MKSTVSIILISASIFGAFPAKAEQSDYSNFSTQTKNTIQAIAPHVCSAIDNGVDAEKIYADVVLHLLESDLEAGYLSKETIESVGGPEKFAELVYQSALKTIGFSIETRCPEQYEAFVASWRAVN